ncbi:OmpW/AlkL family protein [Undibacterium sp. TJN25]|uniref:OmpW/AlkL family protein n=1 Tax=Undibacterium sp. TJN25 TaxID=3413056 RepID=UPI003BF1DF6A
MKKAVMISALSAAVLTLFATAANAENAAATAEASPWMLRVRAVHLAPADKSDPIAGAGVADRLGVSEKTIPEVDISYFFTPNISAELVLTYPQKHDVTLDGKRIGSFKHLPPTLLAQYHFLPEAQFNPYVGAGVNYTRISSVNLLGGAGSLENSSTGLALQAGFDYKVDRHWSFNVDVKKVQIRSDVYISGAKASAVKVDPLMIGVGAGYRF